MEPRILHVDRCWRKGYSRPVSIALTVERGPHAGIARGEILRRLRAMIDLLQLENSEVSFVLTDEARVHRLNKVYRGKDRPTDVLAFAMREGEHADLAGDVLGDVIVSVPTARKQAKERGVAVLDEVTMLLAHGLLHLLGWDHDTAARDRRMKAETARLCAAAAPPPSRRGSAGEASPARGLEKSGSRARGSSSKGGATKVLSRKRTSHGRGAGRGKN
jgi:probable rRNA maturation factor